MAVPSSYLTTTKNTRAVLDAIQKAGVPPKFTYAFLTQLGFPSSSDRPFISVLKALRFLDDGGAPTERYRRFKDPGESGAVMAEALRGAYADVFAVNQDAHRLSHNELKGIFARLSEKGESVTEKMAATFKTLADRADFSAVPEEVQPAGPVDATEAVSASNARGMRALQLRHDVHVHLPATADITVYDAIFRSLREHLSA